MIFLLFKHIKKFDTCWIPDDDKHTLSGELTTGITTPIPTKYIGALSRFTNKEKKGEIDILAIASGPEPQRSIFEQKLRNQLKDKNALLVLGKPEKETQEICGDLRIVSHCNGEELNQAMVDAKIIISRSGYSTIMDLARLGKKAIFVPTPGQTEQTYLAELFYKEKIAFAMHQREMNLDLALEKSTSFNGFKTSQENTDWNSLFKLFEE